MTAPTNPEEHQSTAAAGDDQEIYEYQDSHIKERHGRVPTWLWLVAVGLIVWSGYYLAIYWNAPHPTIF